MILISIIQNAYMLGVEANAHSIFVNVYTVMLMQGHLIASFRNVNIII